MRGSRRRAAASIENPKLAAPRRISDSAPLQAPIAMLAAMPLGAEDLAEHHGQNERDRKSLQRRHQRRQRVVAGEERRRQRLDQHMRGQAKRKPPQRLRGRGSSRMR